LVVLADGFLYVYNLNPNEGGECSLLKQHRSFEVPRYQLTDEYGFAVMG